MDYNPPVGGSAGDPYIDGNPTTGTEGSVPSAASIEFPQREIVAAITAAGLTPDNGTLDQLASAIQIGTLGAAVAGGTADAITAVFDPEIAALIDGMTLCVRAGAANATTTPTFTPATGTIAPKTIVKGAGAALVAGDIAGAGHWIVLRYDQALDVWVISNPATGVIQSPTQYMLVRDEKAIGIHAGASVAGVQTRTLNTVVSNTIPGAALAGNQITLPAGTYRIRGSAPSHTANFNKAILYSVSDAAIALLGTSEDPDPGTQVRSMIDGRMTLGSAKVFEIRQYIGQAVATYGLGVATGQAAVGAEVYTQVEIIKEA